MYKDDHSNSSINVSSDDDTRFGEVRFATDGTHLPIKNGLYAVFAFDSRLFIEIKLVLTFVSQFKFSYQT